MTRQYGDGEVIKWRQGAVRGDSEGVGVVAVDLVANCATIMQECDHIEHCFDAPTAVFADVDDKTGGLGLCMCIKDGTFDDFG